ncbi:MAG: hypothetical protein KDA49_05080 [Rhodospirillaceae bacterium]|nr:hypothetical protein [Rhodospirillaceae bacterium]MCA8931817.1 hypothetical protein [Rhodospirillaceae bacterium]
MALALSACVVQPNTGLGPGNAQATNAAGGHEYGIPPGHYPPPGMCRVWYPGRPPGQQPPVSSCAVVVPPGAVLVYGQ